MQKILFEIMNMTYRCLVRYDRIKQKSFHTTKNMATMDKELNSEESGVGKEGM